MLFFCSPGEFNSWLASLQECSKFILTGSEEHRTTISSKRIGWRKLRRGFWSSKSVDVIWTYIDCYLFLYNEMPYDVICIHLDIYIYMRVTSSQFEESEVKSGKLFFALANVSSEEDKWWRDWIFYCQFLLIDASIDMYGFISLYLIWQGSLR